ncbi:hypothetical protein CICLE_v10013252mg [Citrus x clementina]|uniref:Uncharacterized protein n=1 Tax=Citrus clementina TaxID=85681 RepID=V4USI3_CITCL|nr:hypothetical protein CICLE_v10013252mg [Citrus x clementina]
MQILNNWSATIGWILVCSVGVGLSTFHGPSYLLAELKSKTGESIYRTRDQILWRPETCLTLLHPVLVMEFFFRLP